jgi:predicted dehydrogenase
MVSKAVLFAPEAAYRCGTPPCSRSGPRSARLAVLPVGHPQGYQDCFNLFVADVVAATRTRTAPDGLPLFADGLRAARITEAVLESAASQRWEEVPA